MENEFYLEAKDIQQQVFGESSKFNIDNYITKEDKSKLQNLNSQLKKKQDSAKRKQLIAEYEKVSGDIKKRMRKKMPKDQQAKGFGNIVQNKIKKLFGL